MLRPIQSSDTVKDFLYLFLTDPFRADTENAKGVFTTLFQDKKEIVSSAESNTYKGYVAREAGYGSGMLKAYLYAFKEKTPLITHHLVKEIHRIATAHLHKPGEIHAGEYKKVGNTFSLVSKVELNQNNKLIRFADSHTITLQGLREFIEHWFINSKQDSHSLELNSIDNKNFAILLTKEGDKLTLYTFVNVKRTAATQYNKNSKEALIKHLSDLLTTQKFIFKIQSLQLVADEKVQALSETIMQEIIDSYAAEIKLAKTPQEKTRAIVKHVKFIAQLHPFDDGNIRTCYILLNKLLRENGLPITILFNPNRLDCCSEDEIMEMVAEGQAFLQKILACNNATTINFKFNVDHGGKELTYAAQELFDVDDKLIDEFLMSVTQQQELLPTLAGHKATLFSPVQTNESLEKLKEELKNVVTPQGEREKFNEIIAAVNAGDCSLALRRAASQLSVSAVRIILAHKESLQIDINAKSSNGKTAFDWVEAVDGSDLSKNALMAMLNKAGAVKGRGVNP